MPRIKNFISSNTYNGKYPPKKKLKKFKVVTSGKEGGNKKRKKRTNYFYNRPFYLSTPRDFVKKNEN